MAMSLDHTGSDYRPGACNIGREEINNRWRFGHVNVVVGVALFVVLVALNVAPIFRFVVALPAAIAAACYLEAALKFCVRFGVMGVFNFGRRGNEQQVTDPESRARDRRHAIQISLASLLIGLAVGLIAVLLPV